MARYIQDRVTGEMRLRPPSRRVSVTPEVHGDIEPFLSPIDQRVIGSRRGLRLHNEEHGVEQMRAYGVDDGKEHFERANIERCQRLTGQTKQDREERLAAIIPLVTKHDR